ncbi:arogenate dehydrogenase 2, chloroplastic [Eucalyptus grandis]|nr:arogenate dehydrogenase 2, chloroplastic [Eucalyptus grandis]
MPPFSSTQLFQTTASHLPPLLRPLSPSAPLSPLPQPKLLRRSLKLPLRVRSLDAAQPYDYEAQLRSHFHESSSLKIAILGFGNFGQFLAKTFLSQGHTILAHSRSDYSAAAADLGVAFYRDPHDLCEQHPEVVLLSTSILSTERVLRSIPFQRLRRSTLFVDVLSVKEFPRDLLLKFLPAEFDVLCTHPMFGPESGRHSWAGLSFVYDRVRIGDDESRVDRCEKFLDIFAREGCRMVEMSCAEHDRHAAGSQFVTHTVGRVLEKFGLESSPINTKGYETLLELVENTSGDSFDLYYGLFLYNDNAMEQLQRLDMAFKSIQNELFGRLHQIYRKQLLGNMEGARESGMTKSMVQKLLSNGAPPHTEAPSDPDITT